MSVLVEVGRIFKSKLTFGICIAILAILIVMDYRAICENFALKDKIEEINENRHFFIMEGDSKKEIFLHNQNVYNEIVTKLISSYQMQSTFIEYLEDGKILCNGKVVENDQLLSDIYGVFIQTKMIKPGDKFMINYDYYTPALMETKDYMKDEWKGFPALFKTKESRHRIDFYLIENDYVRMGLKYISIDDVNDLHDHSDRAKMLFGKKLVSGWYYYIFPMDKEVWFQRYR